MGIRNWFSRLTKAAEQPAETKAPAVADNGISAYQAARNHSAGSPVCLAPWTSVSFTISGYATVCCLNRKTSVDIRGKRIDDIWTSEAFVALREQMNNHNLAHDCAVCGQQIEAGNFAGVKAADYDGFYPAHPERPKVMEFCLDNICNLACTMCNSILSSTIRKQQKLPAFQSVYGQDFVEQLDAYIPYLESAVFSGGEPFMNPLYFQIWERMITLNPNLVISVVTNGTKLDNRVKELLERGRFRINVSIDAVDRDLYESIRVNAHFDRVMENLEWFRAYARRKNLPLNIPVCTLSANWHNIPDIVRFANEREISINFVYVDRPLAMSLVNKPAVYLDQIIAHFSSQSFIAEHTIARVNVNRFQGLLRDLNKWRENNLATPASSSADLSPDIDYLSALAKRVHHTTEPGLQDNPAAREDLLIRMVDFLQSMPEEQWSLIFDRINATPLAVIYSYIQGKSQQELAVMFTEYIGIKANGDS